MSAATVLDPASGSRMFYFDKADDRVLFGDIRTEEHVLCDGRSLSINPDMEMDFRALPFEDGAFRVVIFDPPHLVRVGDKAWMGKKYGKLDPLNWQDDLRQGFAECFRVLAEHGVLIFKWNETQIPVSQILALTDHKPLVGHRSGKTARTHWVTFLKPHTEPSEQDAGPLGSGHSPRATGASVGDCGGSVEEPSTHLIHGSASSHESSDPHTADADSPTDQAGTFGAENHPNRTHEGEER